MIASRAKHELFVEAVRQGLQGDAAVEFICHNGYAMNSAAIARHLRAMGGRGKVQQLIESGLTNTEVVHTCFPDAEFEPPPHPPKQEELFDEVPTPPPQSADSDTTNDPLYETTKLTIRIPADLYTAIRLAAKAENKTQSELITEILTSALSRLPEPT